MINQQAIISFSTPELLVFFLGEVGGHAQKRTALGLRMAIISNTSIKEGGGGGGDKLKNCYY